MNMSNPARRRDDGWKSVWSICLRRREASSLTKRPICCRGHAWRSLLAAAGQYGIEICHDRIGEAIDRCSTASAGIHRRLAQTIEARDSTIPKACRRLSGRG
jgi:hypothetical protein